METDWLRKLKPGDEVAYAYGSYHDQDYIIKKVINVTPTGRVTLEGGSKFNNRGIHRSSDRFGASQKLIPVTNKLRHIINAKRIRQNCLNYLHTCKFEDYATNQLVIIVKNLKKMKGNPKP